MQHLLLISQIKASSSIPGCLHACRSSCTALRIMSPQKIPSCRLRANASTSESPCMLPELRYKKHRYHTSRSRQNGSKHLQMLSATSFLSRAHTHTYTDRQIHTHTHSSIPLTFSKPRTHSRTFSRMSVSISQMLGGSCRKEASKGIKPKSGRSRCSCGQLQYPATDCD